MAKDGKKTGAEVDGASVSTAKDSAEAAYTVGEFAANAARLFGEKASADIVTAAFHMIGRESATVSEAKNIVEKFMSREVR